MPLTIIGGLFMIVAYLPVSGWEARVAPYLPLLQIPVTATFGLLAVFACFAIAYDLGKRLKQEAIVSASMATVVFLMIQIDRGDLTFAMDGLGSQRAVHRDPHRPRLRPRAEVLHRPESRHQAAGQRAAGRLRSRSCR